MADMIECPICHCLVDALYEKGCEYCHHENGLPKYTKFWTPITYVPPGTVAIVKRSLKRQAFERIRQAQCSAGAAAGGW